MDKKISLITALSWKQNADFIVNNYPDDWVALDCMQRHVPFQKAWTHSQWKNTWCRLSVSFSQNTRIQIKFQSYKNRIYYFDVYFFYFRWKGKRNIFSLYNPNLLVLKFFKNITGLGQNSSDRLVCVTKVNSCSAELCQSRGDLREHNIFFIFDLKGTLL